MLPSSGQKWFTSEFLQLPRAELRPKNTAADANSNSSKWSGRVCPNNEIFSRHWVWTYLPIIFKTSFKSWKGDKRSRRNVNSIRFSPSDHNLVSLKSKLALLSLWLKLFLLTSFSDRIKPESQIWTFSPVKACLRDSFTSSHCALTAQPHAAQDHPESLHPESFLPLVCLPVAPTHALSRQASSPAGLHPKSLPQRDPSCLSKVEPSNSLPFYHPVNFTHGIKSNLQLPPLFLIYLFSILDLSTLYFGWYRLWRRAAYLSGSLLSCRDLAESLAYREISAV